MSNKLKKFINTIIWKSIFINDSETKYAISNYGDIKNTKTGKCLSLFSKGEGGYLRVNIYHNGKLYAKLVHVLVAETFVEKPIVDDGVKLEVNHIDGKKFNPAASNLEWMTRSDNIKHAIENGLMVNKIGIDHGNCKYTESTIHDVCKLLESGKHPRVIAELLDVQESLPQSIKYYGAWSHISKEYKIPKSGEISKGSRRHPEKSKKYSEEKIREVCRLLEEGHSDPDISRISKVPIGFSADIKGRRTWKKYSDQYNIPYTNKIIRPNNLRERSIKLISAGILSNEELIKILGISDNAKNRSYLNAIKNKFKQQASSTIEHSDVGVNTTSSSK